MLDTNVLLAALLSRRGERALRGNWKDFDRIMAGVPDAPPVAGDER